MNDSPLISVIVPAFNAEKYIGRCLRSLLRQTLSSDLYEVIVVDDCSTDKTSYALELFYDAIKCITNDSNIGLPASLNKALRLARGEFIVRVDSDDYVNKHFLNILYLFITTNCSYDAYACDYLLVDNDENVIGKSNCMDEPIACGIIFKLDDIKSVGLYDESFRCHEDRDLRKRFEQRFKVGRCELPLYRYRRHETNMTNDLEQMKKYQTNYIKKHGTDFQ